MMNGSTSLAAGASSLTASLPFFFLFSLGFFFPLALCMCLPAALHTHERVVCLQLVPVQVSVPLISPTPGCSVKREK